MNFLRSSPASFFSPASLLQVDIFCCWAVIFFSPAAAPWSAFRHSDMNFLRSSPAIFFSPASLLHAPIFCCCGVSFFSSAAMAATGKTRQAAIRSLLIMDSPLVSGSLDPMRACRTGPTNDASLQPVDAGVPVQFCLRALGLHRAPLAFLERRHRVEPAQLEDGVAYG